MTAKSETVGRIIIYKEKQWIYKDTGKPAPEKVMRPCPHCGKRIVGVWVKVSAEDSHTGNAYWNVAGIDHCIAPIIEALQQAGIYTRGCCCSHGKGDGSIILQDGRELIIKNEVH